MFELILSGTVPLICWASATDMLCNSPHGYVLFAVRGEEVVLIEDSDEPAAKPLTAPGEGFHYVIRAKA
jgi:hypothetical protein